MKQELYETQLQLKTKNCIISELQDDVEQLHIVEDENIKLKSEITIKDSDLKQWTVKVIIFIYITMSVSICSSCTKHFGSNICRSNQFCVMFLF